MTYTHKSHVMAVLRASRAQDGARNILQWACITSEHGSPHVTMTKDQLCDVLIMCRNTCQSGLRFLRSEGSLVPVKNTKGGKGIATTYRLKIVGQGSRTAAPGEGQESHTAEQERDQYFKAAARKHGPIKALDLTNKKFGPIE